MKEYIVTVYAVSYQNYTKKVNIFWYKTLMAINF